MTHRQLRTWAIAGAVAAFALSGCGTTLPPKPQSYRQALVEAGVTYSSVARAATVYAQQPRCGTPAAKPPPLCADRDAVVVLGRASEAAQAALRVAEALDGTATPTAQDAALAAVTAALSDFDASTKAAKGK